MTRKQSKDQKKFFGDHLEIKPAFMQKPKSMEEVMAEAFSRSTVENSATVEKENTVAQKTRVEQQKENNATVEQKTMVEQKTTIKNNLSREKFDKVDPNGELAIDSKSTIELITTVDQTTVDQTTVEDKHQAILKPINQDLEEVFLPEKLLSTTVDMTTVENATVVELAMVAKSTVAGIPNRLKADFLLLNRVVTVKWEPFLAIEKVAKDSPFYWQAYTKAWHWIEDEVVPYLDKDSKLTLRKCYRKAFGDLSAKGKFFAGQTLLAQEVGLSKRRIQDILEIFNLLGWVRKIAHHNRGGYKGTDYEMYLPPKAIEYFLEN